MSKETLTRNLRDGELVIKDGTGTPISLTLILDSGDLKWTETDNVIEVKDRGRLNGNAHTRLGDDECCELSFSAKWTQLIQRSVNTSDGLALYEMINGIDGSLDSVGAAGEVFMLKYEFSVTAPSGTAVNGEKITFNKVFKTKLEMSEGADANMISFTGKSFERKPTISRLS